jgi:hypothetical protein
VGEGLAARVEQLVAASLRDDVAVVARLGVGHGVNLLTDGKVYPE